MGIPGSPENEWRVAQRRLFRASSLALFCALIAGAIAGAAFGGLQGAAELALALMLLTLIPIGVVFGIAHDRLSPDGRHRRKRETKAR